MLRSNMRRHDDLVSTCVQCFDVARCKRSFYVSTYSEHITRKTCKRYFDGLLLYFSLCIVLQSTILKANLVCEK